MCHRGQVLVKSTATARKAVELPCRSWLCAECGELRKRELIAQAHRGSPDTFITLTCRRNKYETPELAAVALSNAWRIVRKRALREARRDPSKHPIPFGAAPPGKWTTSEDQRVDRQVRLTDGRLEFIAVIEKHKSGWPHIHILCRSQWIAHKWLSAQMLDVIGSPIVWIERITKRAKVAAYVAKYCAKATEKFKSTKRYWQSRAYQLTRWIKQERTDGWTGQWERAQCSLQSWIAQQRTQGWHAWLVEDHHAMSTPPP